MKRLVAAMAVVFALALGMGGKTAWAGVPQVIAYQGLLTDTQGNPLNGTNYKLIINLYPVATGGSAVWSETWPAVAVTKGVFSLLLGKYTSLASLDFNAQYYLGVSVDGGTELSPRVQLASVATALNADKLDGNDASSFAGISHTHTPGKKTMFTESGTFTVPAGVTQVYVTGVGGGGGGSGNCGENDSYNSTGGGGGACVIAKAVAVTAGTYPVTVGAGGAGGACGGSGTTGGASSFGTLLTVNGGSGTGSGGAAPAGGAPGGSGTWMEGGGTCFGTGGAMNSPANSGGGFGGGGRPGASGNGYNNPGGPGRPGFILVEYY